MLFEISKFAVQLVNMLALFQKTKKVTKNNNL